MPRFELVAVRDPLTGRLLRTEARPTGHVGSVVGGLEELARRLSIRDPYDLARVMPSLLAQGHAERLPEGRGFRIMRHQAEAGFTKDGRPNPVESVDDGWEPARQPVEAEVAAMAPRETFAEERAAAEELARRAHLPPEKWEPIRSPSAGGPSTYIT